MLRKSWNVDVIALSPPWQMVTGPVADTRVAQVVTATWENKLISINLGAEYFNLRMTSKNCYP